MGLHVCCLSFINIRLVCISITHIRWRFWAELWFSAATNWKKENQIWLVEAPGFLAPDESCFPILLFEPVLMGRMKKYIYVIICLPTRLSWPNTGDSVIWWLSKMLSLHRKRLKTTCSKPVTRRASSICSTTYRVNGPGPCIQQKIK